MYSHENCDGGERQRLRDQWNKIENTEVEFHKYVQLRLPQGSNQMELSEGMIPLPGPCIWANAVYWQGRMEKKGREKGREGKKKERGGEGERRKLDLKPNLHPRISPNG